MKTQTDGLWRERRLLNCINAQSLQTCYLVLAGIAVVVLHARFHWPLKLPGHHGLEWIAVLIFARSLSPLPNAATLTAISAAVTTIIPVWGFHDNGAVFSYLIAGAVVDGAYRYSWVRGYVTALALVGGFAHSFKPILHWVFAAGFGADHGSLIHGLPYLLTLHFLFGMTGAITGAFFAKVTQRLRRS